MSAEERLADLLGHYFKTAFEAAGLPWDGDHYAEIGDIAALVVGIAREEARDEAYAAVRSMVSGEVLR